MTPAMTTAPPFSLPAEAAALMHEACAYYGGQGEEVGGYLLRQPDSDAITAVAVAGELGIHRGPRIFIVSGKANESIQDWALDDGHVIAAQWHTHKHHAYMSETDVTSGFNVPGMTTVIIPNFESPPRDFETWGWWVHEAGDWVTAIAATKTSSPVRLLAFDETGVSESE